MSLMEERNDLNNQTGNQEEINTPVYSEPNNQSSGYSKNYYYVWDGENFVKQKKRRAIRALALTVVVALIVSVIGLSAAVYSLQDKNGKDVSDNSEYSESNFSESNTSISENNGKFVNSGNIKIKPKPEDEITTITELYEQVSPSCCSIYIPIGTGYTLGSGFVVDAEEGYIVTNNHVVEDNDGTIQVKFYDGTTYEATLVGGDELTDIAVLKIEAEDLKAIELGDSSQVKVGDHVIAIGTPYDLSLAGTLTNGVISGVDRNIELRDDYGTIVKTMKLLQTNSSINPGNSGGPLINMYGQVVGINTLKLMDEYEGLGFAIPMSYAVVVINNLIDYGEVRDETGLVKATAKLNIKVCTYPTTDEFIKETYELPDNVPEGILVIEVSRNTAIYKAGLEVYDIITEFNGVRIKTYSDLSAQLAKYAAGDQVTLKIYRINRKGTGTYHEITFKLESAK